MTEFTPLSATIGGVLIGLSAGLLWITNGRTAGVSGIFGRVLPFRRDDFDWRLVFLAALPLGAILGAWLGPKLLSEISDARPVMSIGPWLAIIAGLLRGRRNAPWRRLHVGSRHLRPSPVFDAVGRRRGDLHGHGDDHRLCREARAMTRRHFWTLIAAAGSGLIFGVGLAVSRMTDPEKVKSFLDVAAIGDGTWDPSLAFVMGGGLLVAMLFFRLARPMHRPLFSVSFSWPNKIHIDRPLVIGSALFGIGWGLSGLCPGPAIAVLGLAPDQVAVFAVSMLAGSWGASIVLNERAARASFAGSSL